MGGAERHQAFGATSDEADDSGPDTERDGDDGGLQDVSTNGWEEFGQMLFISRACETLYGHPENLR